MLNFGRLVFAAALCLSACGGGGGDSVPPPPAAATPSDALRLSAQAVTDVAELAWALSTDLQITVTTAPSETVRTLSCAQGGTNVVTRPSASLLRIEHRNCRIGGTLFAGLDSISTRLKGVSP